MHNALYVNNLKRTIYMLKVAWVLKADGTVGSSRIHGINVHLYLQKNNWNSNIITSPRQCSLTLNLDWETLRSICDEKYDLIIFQEVAYGNASFLNYMQCKQGKKTCFLICDLLKFPLLFETSAVITTSEYLKIKLQSNLKQKIYVIPDSLEVPSNICKSTYKQLTSKIRLVWFGNKENMLLCSEIQNILKNPRYKDMELVVISNSPDSDILWDNTSLNNNWNNIIDCDIGIIPSLEKDWFMAKSNNKLTTLMALGMPVIAFPIPAYQEILCHGVNGLLAKSIAEWQNALDFLKDENNRKAIGNNARKDVVYKFSIENIIKIWEQTFTNIVEENTSFHCSLKKWVQLQYFKLYFFLSINKLHKIFRNHPVYKFFSTIYYNRFYGK